jgi:DNA-binding GntR family transcriptional regulator
VAHTPVLPLEIVKDAAPLRQRVENALRQAIIDGQLRPGQRITERELTARMGVSRTLVREALRRLESEGLIAIIPNRGPIVKELTADEVRELYAIRAVLEGLAARLFAENADDATLKTLGKAAAAVIAAYEAAEPARALEGKNRFYDILVAGSGSTSLSTMLATLHTRIRQWRAVGITHPQRSPGRAKEAIAGVKAIWLAVKKRDAAAAESATRDEARRGAAELMRLLAAAPEKRTAQM